MWQSEKAGQTEVSFTHTGFYKWDRMLADKRPFRFVLPSDWRFTYKCSLKAQCINSVGSLVIRRNCFVDETLPRASVQKIPIEPLQPVIIAKKNVRSHFDRALQVCLWWVFYQSFSSVSSLSPTFFRFFSISGRQNCKQSIEKRKAFQWVYVVASFRTPNTLRALSTDVKLHCISFSSSVLLPPQQLLFRKHPEHRTHPAF